MKRWMWVPPVLLAVSLVAAIGVIVGTGLGTLAGRTSLVALGGNCQQLLCRGRPGSMRYSGEGQSGQYADTGDNERDPLRAKPMRARA